MKMFIIMLPPVSTYPEPPPDQPDCCVTRCPQCQKPAWMSEKKQKLVAADISIYVACYFCIEKMANEKKGIFAPGQKNDRISI